MIRIRYNRIPHPAQDTKRERNTNAKGGMTYKTILAESQEGSFFQQITTRLHAVAILNKANITPKADEQGCYIEWVYLKYTYSKIVKLQDWLVPYRDDLRPNPLQ